MRCKGFYTVLIIIASLTVGVGVGYFYGQSLGEQKGVEDGRIAVLAEQVEIQKARVAALEKDIKKATNPFSEEGTTVNPFKDENDGYANPFEGGSVNPFAQ